MKYRLDQILVLKYGVKSRNRAQVLIRANTIKVDGKIINKPSYEVLETTLIEFLESEFNRYVSRGGLKLEHALKTFKYNVIGKNVLDIGASTGGFTDCLLQHGANQVIAVDSGTNQLAQKLKVDSRVKAYENNNFREFNLDLLPKTLDLVTIDVSFISVNLILQRILEYINLNRLKTLDLIVLIKPEFELYPSALNHQGQVKSLKLVEAAVIKVVDYANLIGFIKKDIIVSPLLGAKSGNQEYLGYFQYKKDVKSDRISNEINKKG
jgi:23S rRNA (cytidine1920-2'-O)/16S rRNA (cytidine1409-2'-O)-methyltransferase